MGLKGFCLKGWY